MTLENNYDIKSLTTPAATGGTITTSGGYRIHTFTSSGTFISNKSMNVEYLVVAGGGGGGVGTSNNGNAGGGGAGGLRNGTIAVSAQPYPVTVGAGGTTSGYYCNFTNNSIYNAYCPTNGGNSILSSVTSIGGGYGGFYHTNAAGSGGSGGGSGQYSSTPGAGTASQGYAGGSGSGNGYAGGGGGGAGGVGNPAWGSGQNGGNGGPGIANSISGTSVTYAGGGAGSAHGSSTSGVPQGGAGGGGNGHYGALAGVNGTPNTGGGGGGGGENVSGGNGGSGIVIISYPLSQDILTPANIIATSMTVSPPSESPCRTGICTVGVSVTWTNNGNVPETFVPSLTFSGGTITPTYSSEPLAASASVVHTFTISNMTAGSHSICPNPN
jgi:hypothetical protein